MVKKVILTLAGPNMLPVLNSFSLPTFKKFATQHNYEMYVERLDIDSMHRKDVHAKNARWQKITLMKEALKQYDVAVWFDADILIKRYDQDILDNLSAEHFQGLVLHSVPAENRINPNTGVWIMRSTPQAFRFLEVIEKIGMPEGRWADQGAILRALEWELGDENYYGAKPPENPNEFARATAWLPIGWNQPYCEDRSNPEKYIGRPLVKKPNAIHFMAMTIDERLKIMPKVVEAATPYEQV